MLLDFSTINADIASVIDFVCPFVPSSYFLENVSRLTQLRANQKHPSASAPALSSLPNLTHFFSADRPFPVCFPILPQRRLMWSSCYRTQYFRNADSPLNCRTIPYVTTLRDASSQPLLIASYGQNVQSREEVALVLSRSGFLYSTLMSGL